MNSESSSKSSKANKIWIVGAFLGVIVILALVGTRLFQQDHAGVALGEKPKDFTLVTFSGETIDTSELRDQVVLINFWSSWCTTCEDEARLLEEAWQFYKANGTDDIAFLGVTYMDTEPASRAFIEEYSMTYPNGPDLQGAISGIYQVNTVPETYILDQEGNLRYVKFGPFISIDEIVIAIESVK